jgi:hypothetical protein
MMRPHQFDIRGSGTSWIILQGKARVGGTYRGHHLAVAAVPGIERRAAQAGAVTRPCLSCGAEFRSLHKGHRRCRSCKRDG